jgi:glycosyltransferase involved in cell wall biosynthesis
VRPGSAAELADAIEPLARDPAEREALGAQGYQIYKTRFRWQTIRAQYLDLVRSTLPVAKATRLADAEQR